MDQTEISAGKVPASEWVVGSIPVPASQSTLGQDSEPQIVPDGQARI